MVTCSVRRVESNKGWNALFIDGGGGGLLPAEAHSQQGSDCPKILHRQIQTNSQRNKKNHKPPPREGGGEAHSQQESDSPKHFTEIKKMTEK